MSGDTEKSLLKWMLKSFKSRSNLKKVCLNNFEESTKHIEDNELSYALTGDSARLIRGYKFIERLMDRYIFVERHKSIKEQLKFFHNVTLNEEERKQLNYLRFILCGNLYRKCFVDCDIICDKDKLKHHLAELNYGSMRDDIPYLMETYTTYVCNGDVLKSCTKLIDLGIIYYRYPVNTEDTDNVARLFMFLNIIEYMTNSEKYNSDNFGILDYRVSEILKSTLLLIPKSVIDSNINLGMKISNITDVSALLEYLVNICWYASMLDMTKQIVNNYEGSINLAGNRADFYRTSTDWGRGRKVLVPNKGVVLLINDNVIESMRLEEFHKDNMHYIEVKVQYRKPIREVQTYILPVLNKEIHISFLYKSSEEVDNDRTVADVVDYLADFLGIELEGEIIGKTKPYDVISPVYWKYRDNNYLSPKDHEAVRKGMKLKREYTIEVSAHLRKGNPSQDAKNLADSLCIKLPEGYTVVREHNRTYNKTKKLEVIKCQI